MTSPDAESLPPSHIDAYRGTRFTLRTLLIVVSGIGVILGYWVSLPTILPEWNRLLNQITAAHQNIAEKGMLYGKAAAFSDRRELTPLDFAVGILTLLAFYAAKILISRRIHHWATKLVAYVMLVSLILPYIFIRWEDWDNPFIYFVGNWFGVSVAVLAIPTITFVVDLLSETDRSTRWVLGRSAIEMLVGIPVWAVFWAFFSFFMLEFGWI